MKKDKTGLSEAMDLFIEEEAARTDAVAPEELQAYVDGTLSSASQAALRARLVTDKQAVRALLALQGLREGEALKAHEALTEEAGEAAWRDLQDRLSADEAADDAYTDRRLPVYRRLSVGLAVACALLLFWGLSLQREAARLARPHLENGLTVYIADPLVRASETPDIILQADRQNLMLRLPRAMRTYPLYRVVIEDASTARPVVTLHQNGPCEALALSLPRNGRLHPGAYTLRLFGERDGVSEPLAACRLLVNDGSRD